MQSYIPHRADIMGCPGLGLSCGRGRGRGRGCGCCRSRCQRWGNIFPLRAVLRLENSKLQHFHQHTRLIFTRMTNWHKIAR